MPGVVYWSRMAWWQRVFSGYLADETMKYWLGGHENDVSLPRRKIEKPPVSLGGRGLLYFNSSDIKIDL